MIDQKAMPGVHRVRCKPKVAQMLFDEPGQIGWGSNGGFQAINLAAQFGATRIVLIGFDMSLERGVHWHGSHPPGLNNPRQASVEKWRRELDGEAPNLEKRGIDVVIGSPHSRLTAFRRQPIEEVLRGI